VHDAERCERVKPCPDGRTADANPRGQSPFGGQSIARPQTAAFDQPPDEGDNLFAAAFRAPARTGMVLPLNASMVRSAASLEREPRADLNVARVVPILIDEAERLDGQSRRSDSRAQCNSAR
jgi:hypothetical protein